MNRSSFFKLYLTNVDLNKILAKIYDNIEKTNDNKLKNIYQILDKYRISISFSDPSKTEPSTEIKLNYNQWLKVINCCRSNEKLSEYLENKINYLKNYPKNQFH